MYESDIAKLRYLAYEQHMTAEERDRYNGQMFDALDAHPDVHHYLIDGVITARVHTDLPFPMEQNFAYTPSDEMLHKGEGAVEISRFAIDPTLSVHQRMHYILRLFYEMYSDILHDSPVYTTGAGMLRHVYERAIGFKPVKGVSPTVINSPIKEASQLLLLDLSIPENNREVQQKLARYMK